MTVRGRCYGHLFQENRVGSPCLGGGAWLPCLEGVWSRGYRCLSFCSGRWRRRIWSRWASHTTPPFLLPHTLWSRGAAHTTHLSIPSPLLPCSVKSDSMVSSRWTDHNLSFSCHTPLDRVTIPPTLNTVTIPLHLEKDHVLPVLPPNVNRRLSCFEVCSVIPTLFITSIIFEYTMP